MSFLLRVRWFSHDFHEWWSYKKSLLTLTHTSFYFLDAILCHEHTNLLKHYDNVKMGTIASQITSLTIVYSTVYLDTDQSKHQSSASPAFVWGIHRGPVNSPHKWTVTRKMFPFEDVIMKSQWSLISPLSSRTVFSDLALSCHHSWSVTSRERQVLALWRHIQGLFMHMQIGAKTIFTIDVQPWISISHHLVFMACT